MTSDRVLPVLDFSKLELPTDDIKMRVLRHDQPGLFNGLVSGGYMTHLNIAATIGLEMQLASRAYAKAQKRPNPFPSSTRSQDIALINLDYIRFGISSGLHETEELIRRVELSAAAQAKSDLSRSR